MTYMANAGDFDANKVVAKPAATSHSARTGRGWSVDVAAGEVTLADGTTKWLPRRVNFLPELSNAFVQEAVEFGEKTSIAAKMMLPFPFLAAFVLALVFVPSLGTEIVLGGATGVSFFWVAVASLLAERDRKQRTAMAQETPLPYNYDSNGPVVFVVAALMERFTKGVLRHGMLHAERIPIELLEAVDRVVGKPGDDDFCLGVMGLLSDDLYFEDVLQVLYAVAATNNEDTLETARRTLHTLIAKRADIERAKLLAQRQEARELATAQPDYSDEIAAVAERHMIVDEEL